MIRPSAQSRSTPTPTPATGKTQVAYDWLASRISTGRLPPGHRLVLARLAAEIGVSVVPVREAIRRLEAEGVVVWERHVGATVAMADPRAYAEVMETVAICEAAATALAAPALTSADLAEAAGINHQMRMLTETIEGFDPVRFTRLNQAFHRLLFGRCPNRHLVDLVERDWQRLDDLRETTFSFIPQRARASVAEHAELLALLARGEPATIEAAARAHRLATLAAYRTHIAHDAGHGPDADQRGPA